MTSNTGSLETESPLIAHSAKRQHWAKAAADIADGLKHYKGQDAAFRAAMAAFESTDPDALAVERIIKAMWNSPDWSLSSVALACYKAGRETRLATSPTRSPDAEGGR